MTAEVRPRPVLAGFRGERWSPVRRRRGDPTDPVTEAPAGSTRWIWGGAAVLFLLYAALSVRHHERLLSSGHDLGIFEQAVRSYAHGHLPIAELKGPDFPVLGDHFSPILALLAPIYRLFPSPVTLLVAQAALLAVAVVPLASAAQRALGRAAALVVGAGYGLSWGIAQAVAFDFHEIAFAVPMIAFGAVALGERRTTAAVLWALPLLLVKEDLGLTVAVVGVLVACFGRRALGLATAFAGLAGTMLEVLVVLPHFNLNHGFEYWDNLGSADQSEPGGPGLLSLLERVTVGLVQPQPKGTLLVMLLAPTAMLALRSPLLLLALPTLAWRFVADYPPYWGTEFHYSAVLMPIVFAAFVDSLRRWAHPDGRTRAREALTACAVVTGLLLPQFPLADLVRPSTWREDPRVAAAHRLLARIPDGVHVAASNRLAPHLTSRNQVSLFGWPDARADPDWIVIDQDGPLNWPFPSLRSQAKYVEEVVAAGYVRVAEDEKYLLLRRPGG